MPKKKLLEGTSSTMPAIAVSAVMLGNWAWGRIMNLMEEESLGNRENIDLSDVEEAEALLKFKRAIAERRTNIILHITYEESK